MSADPATRLNWGCGARGEPGWTNADLKSGPGIELPGDIRRGLAVDDATFLYASSMHALCMIPYPDLVPVLAELRRVLRDGGVLRLGLPDLDKGIAAYLEGRDEHFLVPEETTLSGRFIVHMLWYGYSTTLFTAEFADDLLRRAGFTEVRHCGFGRSGSPWPEIVELDNRPHESFFVEAVR